MRQKRKNVWQKERIHHHLACKLRNNFLARWIILQATRCNFKLFPRWWQIRSLQRALLPVGGLCFVDGSRTSKELIVGFVQGNTWYYFNTFQVHISALRILVNSSWDHRSARADVLSKCSWPYLIVFVMKVYAHVQFSLSRHVWVSLVEPNFTLLNSVCNICICFNKFFHKFKYFHNVCRKSVHHNASPQGDASHAERSYESSLKLIIDSVKTEVKELRRESPGNERIG